MSMIPFAGIVLDQVVAVYSQNNVSKRAASSPMQTEMPFVNSGLGDRNETLASPTEWLTHSCRSDKQYANHSSGAEKARLNSANPRSDCRQTVSKPVVSSWWRY